MIERRRKTSMQKSYNILFQHPVSHLIKKILQEKNAFLKYTYLKINLYFTFANLLQLTFKMCINYWFAIVQVMAVQQNSLDSVQSFKDQNQAHTYLDLFWQRETKPQTTGSKKSK